MQEILLALSERSALPAVLQGQDPADILTKKSCSEKEVEGQPKDFMKSNWNIWHMRVLMCPYIVWSFYIV